MTAMILGRKVGMTRYYLEDGTSVPVTVIDAAPCVVTQVKTNSTDGYAAVQVGGLAARPRRSTMPQIGHDAKAGVGPQRMHREFRFDDDKTAEGYEIGQSLTVEQFTDVMYVDVVGINKGKGFQGGMKRHGFKGQCASHGIKRVHRSPGSINGHATNLGTGPKPKKGKRMAGHMGAVRVTSRSMSVVSIDTERNLLLVKGTIPGPNQGLLQVYPAKRLNRQKGRLARSAS